MEPIREVGEFVRHPGTQQNDVYVEPRANSGFVVCDNGGKVVVCSPVAAAIFGGSSAAMENTPVEALLCPNRHDDASAQGVGGTLAYLSTRVGWRCFDARTVDGHRFRVALAVMKIEVEGVALFLLRLYPLQDA